MKHSTKFALTRMILILLTSVYLANDAHARVTKWSIPKPALFCKLEYYVHVDNSGNNLGQLIPPINNTKSAKFGATSLFALNATDGPDAATSKSVGCVRGYTVQGSYVSEESHGIEVEILSYDDGSLNGTISLQGLVNNGINEIAIVGGTGDFRGVRGYGVVANITSSVFHHTLHIGV